MTIIPTVSEAKQNKSYVRNVYMYMFVVLCVVVEVFFIVIHTQRISKVQVWYPSYSSAAS